MYVFWNVRFESKVLKYQDIKILKVRFDLIKKKSFLHVYFRLKLGCLWKKSITSC